MTTREDVPVRTLNQQRGDAAEDLVAGRLRAVGWTILARNLHVGRSEVDLLAIDPTPPGRLVLVEVRWRKGTAFGLPEETFDPRKRGHLRTALAQLLAVGRLPDGRALPRLHVAGDLVVVGPPVRAGDPPEIRHHRDVLTGR